MDAFTPRNFETHFTFIITFLITVGAILGGFGLYMVFFTVPDDYLQQGLVKIMYVHVPASWLALFCYCAAAGCNLLYLSIKSQFYNIIARSILPVGLTMTIISLITGSIWGKPAWGTWWVWDARLTSMLILMFIYLGCIILQHAFWDEMRGANASAIFNLMGLVNIPIIKFSVNMWHTLHQPSSVLRLGAPTIHSSMLYPLIVMFIAFACLVSVPIMLNIKSALLSCKLRRMIS